MNSASNHALSPDQLAELSAARIRARKVRRSVGVARFSGWTTGAFGGLTLLGALFGSLPALLLGLAMGFCGWNELRAAAQLQRLEPRAPRRLAINQLILCACLCAYCAWNVFHALTKAPSSSLAGMPGGAGSGADEILADMDSMTRGISVIVYGSAIVICMLVQGLTALYYLSRARLLRDYVAATPAWVIEIQKAA